MKNKQGGFLKLIFFLVVALFVLKYLNLTVYDVWDWLKATFGSVF